MQSSELGGTAHYVFVIGSTDDFESAEELDDAVDARMMGCFVSSNFSYHRFSVPAGLDEETITLIGRGLAFSNGWCEDDTISYVMLDPDAYDHDGHVII